MNRHLRIRAYSTAGEEFLFTLKTLPWWSEVKELMICEAAQKSLTSLSVGHIGYKNPTCFSQIALSVISCVYILSIFKKRCRKYLKMCDVCKKKYLCQNPSSR